jgi:hypothetical protein
MTNRNQRKGAIRLRRKNLPPKRRAPNALPTKKDAPAKSNERAGRDDDERRGGGRKASKRERLAQARREAEERRAREAEERRRREEAARRAELARQAAIARQRALDKALRDEVAENILRDDPTGEDPEVRRVAVNALGYHAGSVVVMNPKTGQVYTIVNQEWGVRRGFKPCSTIKLVSGLAGVVEGVIDPAQENIAYSNYRMNLNDALARSNNGYFQQVGGGSASSACRVMRASLVWASAAASITLTNLRDACRSSKMTTGCCA